MTLAIYSNAGDAAAGGGVLYATALAAALAAGGEPVDLLFRRPVTAEALRRRLPVDLDGVTIGLVTPPGRLAEARALLAPRYRRVVVQSTEVPRLRGRRVGLLCEFPGQRRLGPTERLRLALHRPLVANSEFTARWIERWWGRRAAVLPPPLFPVPPREKEPWILMVGRFTGGGRPKGQLEMVEVFRRLLADGVAGWQLHLAGPVADEDYLAATRAAAAGLPVRFHLDLERAELETLYGRSSIFWHATGHAADPEREPQRMEHFGIATAEAMSAGAVPVVTVRGGQPEVVGDAGCLWPDLDTCRRQTLDLCRDAAARARLGDAARRRAERFAFPRFAERARELFGGGR